jgi:hypothetical protein
MRLVGLGYIKEGGLDVYMITMALYDERVRIYRQAAIAAVWRGIDVAFLHYIL